MNRFPRHIQVYIVAVIAASTAVLIAGLPQRFDGPEILLLVTLVLSGTLAGVYPLPLIHRHGMIDLTGGILLMAIFLGSPGQAVLLAAIIAVLSGFMRHRRLWNVLFMAGVNIISVGFAATLYQEAANPALLPMDSWKNALGLGLAASSYWLAISVLVTVLVAARNDSSFARTFVNNWKDVYLQCVLLTLLAVLGTAAWRQGPVYAFLLLVPAVAIYQLLSTNRIRHQQAIHAIEIIAEVLDRRVPFAFDHSHRVAQHATSIARTLGLGDQDVEALRRAALIHDIGKLGTEDPADDLPATWQAMTAYQFYSLKQHAQLGAMIAREIPAFEEAEDMIRYHHDWYDGSHTSRDHAGDGIPLGARIIAVAESYDGLCMANGEVNLAYDSIAANRLRLMAGKQLDPDLTRRFLAILESSRLKQSAQASSAHLAPA